MKTLDTKALSALQKKPSCIRNICILAHVDHGKTTLADSLVASNGIISQRMAGKLRYMDSREDEQIRGITMKSSAISLMYKHSENDYLINLIDSPGHVDFSSEVSTAVRLCDGAIVVVDVVEGVCPQTHAVLRQAWLENIKPILVLNKIDRLIAELKMDPLEAFYQLQQTLEQVNLVTSELFTSEIMEKSSNQSNGNVNIEEFQSHDTTSTFEDTEKERNIFFSPDQGNVIFASAVDGWGFTCGQFAKLFSKKTGINKDVLLKTLWGDYFLNSKTKRIMKGAQTKGKKPLFVQVVLENIWSVYEAVYVRKDKDMIEKIVNSLDLKVSPRDIKHNDPKVQIKAITTQWLPLSEAVLGAVVEKLPSPLQITGDRIEKLMCPHGKRFDKLPQKTQQLKEDFMKCIATEEAPVIVFVSKMVPVERTDLPQNKQRPLTDEDIQKRREQARLRHAQRMATSDMGQTTSSESGEKLEQPTGSKIIEEEDVSDKESPVGSDTEPEADQTFIAFARVMSGVVKKGQKLYVLGPKHDPEVALKEETSGHQIDDSLSIKDLSSDIHITVATVTDVYLFMGRELELTDSVPAGNVLGIGGLEDHILKSGTVSSTVACPAFTDLYFDASPIVRVALEPKHAVDMKKLVQGLKLLNQADPCVQVMVQETGEHVIVTAGEVHLQRCVDDLKERYAKIELNVSEAIVPFRETIIIPPKVDMVNEVIQDTNVVIKTSRMKEFEDDDEVLKPGLIQTYTANKKCCVVIRAQPLPDDITKLLEDSIDLLKVLDHLNKTSDIVSLNLTIQEGIKDFKSKLSKIFDESGKFWRGAVDQIWAFGPRRVGPNLLLNRIPEYKRQTVWTCLDNESEGNGELWDLDNSFVSGFQIATLSGPLCEEPMRGVCFVIEKWEMMNDTDKSKDSIEKESHLQNESRSECSKTSVNDCDIDNIQKLTSKMDFGSKCNSENEVSCDKIEDSVSRKKTETYGQFSGQLISCIKDGCRKAFQTQSQRLVVAMYKCNIQATAEVLGKLFAVLGKRNGRVIEDEMREGSQIFNIIAALPVVESFGFADDIRKKTSGLASPQLVFSHWEVVDIDPFWIPTTEEEYLHYGEKADSENRAHHYMNTVRKRKGLKLDKKIVEHAEKQRTLTKNK
ncbi:ribosome assembly protein 1 [Mytilus galloprovincialis]|uniref:Ribosome assembly protein 1 n=1 Tax=Mytilus galloprovincialis TaxID=29158 RepID=A0A8B6H4C7_MYTGA|nr:ribosome assembly protein 1 [Mytilus galloprovincialis]